MIYNYLIMKIYEEAFHDGSKLVTLPFTVNELNGFTKAAQKLSLNRLPASMSGSWRRELRGLPFCCPRGGNLKLTSEGEIVIKYAKRIVSLYQNLQQSLKDERRHAPKREITVGIRTYLRKVISWVEVLAKYSSFSEGTRITIISDAINNLYMKLKTYEIDQPLWRAGLRIPISNSVMLDTDSLILAVSKRTRFQGMVTLNELKKENLILRPDSGTRKSFISI